MRGIRCVAAAVVLAAQPTLTGAASQHRAATLGDLSRPFEAAVREAAAATVQVIVRTYGPVETLADGAALVGASEVSGSGVIVDPDGFIITNEHVVQGAEHVKVFLTPAHNRSGPPRATIQLDARIVGVHRESDLALLKVEATGLPYLALADARPARQGQLVFAIGSPCGLENTMTMGIVSAERRQPDPDASMAYIQTDASLLPGNSGGALVDADGHLLGINASVLAADERSDGPGLAIPAEVVEHVYRSLREHGRVRRADMGIAAQTITPALAQGLGLAQTTGVIVADIFPFGPAARAGIRTGDVLVTVAGAPVRDLPELVMRLYRHDPSRPMNVAVSRDAQMLSFSVGVIQAGWPDSEPSPFAVERRDLLEPLGAFATDVTRALVRHHHLRSREGVFITALAADFQPALDGLAVGDVIVAVNGTTVKDVEAVRTLLGRVAAERSVVFHIERRGTYRYVVSGRDVPSRRSAGAAPVRASSVPGHATFRSIPTGARPTLCPGGGR
jgi:serine protease Do